MARHPFHDVTSDYYPPRARWYSAFFYLGDALRRRLFLDRLKLPRKMKAGEMVAGFFVPGLAFWLRGPRLWGQLAMAASAVLFFILFAFLGHSIANLALGLLISLHATGFYYYCSPIMAEEPFGRRLALALLILLAIGLLLYTPTRSFIQRHWLTPLRMHGEVFVVQRTFQPDAIHRGDWVAYALHASQPGQWHEGAVISHGGLDMGPVLAMAGDHLQFSTNSFSVNGILHTNLPHMPTAGEFIVPENHWFIWPNLDISGHGNVGEANISQAMFGLANVSKTQMFGRPFNQWFWRQQILP